MTDHDVYRWPEKEQEKRMRVLVTGSSGFIGREVMKRLIEVGHEPIEFNLPDHDVRNHKDVGMAMKEADAVIHLAGVLGTHELFDVVDLAIESNIIGTMNVLDACAESGARYVGITMPQVFPSIYTATKIAATALATAYHERYKFAVAHVRAFNAFGPGQAHGEGHPQKIIPTFATAAWAGRPIPIWGDGTQGVDLISSKALAKVLVVCLKLGSYSSTSSNCVVDGGSGFGRSVIDVAREVCTIAGVDPLIQFLPMRRGEVPTQIRSQGDGWMLINDDDVPAWHDKSEQELLIETVHSYKSHPLAQ